MSQLQIEGAAIVTQLVYLCIVGWIVVVAIIGHWLYKIFKMTDQERRVMEEYRRTKRQERINNALYRPRP